MAASKKKRKAAAPPTYEQEVLAVLAYELTASDRVVSDRKLKRRLREKKLGQFEAARVEALRAFQNGLLAELSKPRESKFFAGSSGGFSDMRDWKLEELIDGMARVHPDVPREAIAGFVPFGIYLYYLR